MQQCPKCHAQLDESAVFCTACGAKIGDPVNAAAAPVNAVPPAQQPFQPAVPRDERKTYSLMAHIPLLWLIGMFSAPEKYDSRVRFNVGQGIVASIAGTAGILLAVIFTVINNAVFKTDVYYYGMYTGETATSAVGVLLNVLVWLAASGIIAFYAIYGVIKVSKNADTYLPIIGRFAFYK